MLTWKIKGKFFDRAPVIRAIGPARAKALSKAGAFIRRRAQTSMRRRKAPSKPGTPPSVHTGDLRRLIFFGYEKSSESVVVGPIKFKSGEAPPLNEFGGERPFRVKDRGGAERTIVLVYPARPFMGPALRAEAAAGTIPKHWQNTVRSTV